jgi:hypothetical protein
METQRRDKDATKEEKRKDDNQRKGVKTESKQKDENITCEKGKEKTQNEN